MGAPSPFFLQQSGSAQITLTRLLDQGTLSVEFSTNSAASPESVPGTTGKIIPVATPGQQYLPVDETVTFQPGQTTLTVSVPIVPNAANPGIVLVDVTTKPLVTGGSAQTGEFAIVSGPDQLPLAINNARIDRQGSGASAIAVTFSAPMVQASVENLQHFRIMPLGHSAGVVSLQSATYDAATYTVNLVTKKPLNPARVYEVAIYSGQGPTGRREHNAANGGNLIDQAGNSLTLSSQPLLLPQSAGGNLVDLSRNSVGGDFYAPNPMSFSINGRSSGPPQLNLIVPPMHLSCCNLFGPWL
jgi:hypothetical protein